MKEIEKVKIKGVTGIRYIALLDRLDGKNDARNNQVCKTDQGITTPRIIQKCRSCDRYTNEMYIGAVNELRSLYTEIAVCIKELLIMNENPEEDAEANTGPSQTTEEGKRRADARIAEAKAKENRKKALMLRLAELKQNCHNIDETLKHNLDRAKSTLFEHVETYWSGVLQSESGISLPVMPSYSEENISGKAEYSEQYARIMEMFGDIDKEVNNELV